MIHPTPLGRLAAVAALALAGCAPRGTFDELGEPTLDLRDLDVPPRLLGCAGYTEPASTSGRMQSVWVAVLVGSDGRAHDLRAPRLNTGPASLDTRLSDSVRERAADLAWGCAFQPGQLGGQAVAVWQTVSFRLAP